MSRLPYLIFFLSGASALIFENLWFRLAGLNVGNSVWGAAVVLAGFMGGLGLGNWLVTRYGHNITRPIYTYILLEVLIGIFGLGLVLVFPYLPGILSPVFQPFLDYPFVLNTLRTLSIFTLLLIPTAAMGATLPIMVKAVCNFDANFGSVLGRLYGWNTLGAVTGVLCCEFILIELTGIRNSSFVAIIFNLLAIFIAIRLDPDFKKPLTSITKEKVNTFKDLKLTSNAWRLMSAAFLTGMILLALEVIWFRFLLLTISGTSVIFAIMLVIVLTGIGLGGLLVSLLYKRQFKITVFSRELALMGGILTILTYVSFHLIYFRYAQKSEPPLSVFIVYSSFLILPISLISGMLFTTLGQGLKNIIPKETTAVGLLTLSNTTGAMFGALIAGLILLSIAGMELSFWLLSICFGLVALIIPGIGDTTKKNNLYVKYILSSVFLCLIIFFPFGLMKEQHFHKVFEKWGASKVVSIKEGLVATNFYYQFDTLGKPNYYRLMTNGYSMSGTSWAATRYMKLFVYWPKAINSNLKNALLISYGVGSTAKALTDTASLNSIDIVDISKDILDMSSILYPDPNEHPLNDPRVNVHIEDGRFFLQTTEKKYDLITGEPPPPKINHVVNLYTQEYFKLIYDHLAEGGITTYWLPVYQLKSTDSKSIIKAFCNVFKDCSLWTGAGLEWMLVGSKNINGSISIENFTKQWEKPGSLTELQNLGLERPEQLGALFLADSGTLNDVTINTLPLTDNHPQRLSSKKTSLQENAPFYHFMMEPNLTKERFINSNFIKKIWPQTLKNNSIKYFKYQGMMSDVFFNTRNLDEYNFNNLHDVLTNTSLESLPLWILGSNYKEKNIVNSLINEGNLSPEIFYHLSKYAIAERNYSNAASYIKKFIVTVPTSDKHYFYPLYIYSLCMSGNITEAKIIIDKLVEFHPINNQYKQFNKWISQKFELNKPDK